MANEIEPGRLPQGAVSRSTPATLALPLPLSALLLAQVNLELATAAIFVLQADPRGGHAAGRRAPLVAAFSTGPFARGRHAGWSRGCRARLCVWPRPPCEHANASPPHPQAIAESDAAAKTEGGRSSPPGLKGWLVRLNAQSEKEFKKSLRLILKPEQQMMWNKVYEVALIHDPDGVMIKVRTRRERCAHALTRRPGVRSRAQLMNFQTELTHFMYPDWELTEDGVDPRGKAVQFGVDAQVDEDGNILLDDDGKFVQ